MFLIYPHSIHSLPLILQLRRTRTTKMMLLHALNRRIPHTHSPRRRTLPHPIVIVRFAEHVALLIMNGHVTQEQLLVRHAQRHADHVFDEEEDERGPDDVPGDDG